jgi:hypothetical protein
LYEWYNANINLQRARTFHITFFYYFSGQSSTPAGSIPDITFDLTVNYPHGTLIVDDPITISGIALVNASIPQHIRSMTVYFKNAQAYPPTQDVNSITKGTDLLLFPTQNSSIFTGTATMIWTLEGTYNPYFIVTYETGTRVYATPLLMSDVFITVYPKMQYAQTVTNNVSMILAISVYIFTLVGTLNFVLSLWDRQPSTQENKNNRKDIDAEINIAKGNTYKP